MLRPMMEWDFEEMGINSVGNIRIIDGFLLAADTADVGEVCAAAEQNGKEQSIFCRRFFIQGRNEAQGDQIGFEFRFRDGVEKNTCGNFFSIKNIVIHFVPTLYNTILRVCILIL